MNSIEKALEILLAFTPDNRPLRTVEISHRLAMNKATVNRILITLKNKGFVAQDQTTRRYRLGPSTALLGRAVKQSLDGRLVALAKPYLDGLRDKVGETVHLEVLFDDRIFLTYSARGPRTTDRHAPGRGPDGHQCQRRRQGHHGLLPARDDRKTPGRTPDHFYNQNRNRPRHHP